MNSKKHQHGRVDSNGPTLDFVEVVDEVVRYGLLNNPDILPQLIAVGMNPHDVRAIEHLQFCLELPRMIATLFPNPFAPCPVPGEVDGHFRFARIKGQEDNHIALNESELNCNTGIYGALGSGKTTVIKNLLTSILDTRRHVLFNAFTKKDDLPGLAKVYPDQVHIFDDATPYNHLFPMGDSPYAHALTTAQLLLYGEDFLPGTTEFLADAIISQYARNGVFNGSEKYPVWAEIHSHISAAKPLDNMQKYYRTILGTKIRGLMDAFGPALSYRKGLDHRDAIIRNMVFVQRPTIPPSIRRFHLLDYLTRIFKYRQRYSFEEIGKQPLIVCVIDDADEIFSNIALERRGDPPPIFNLITIARQYRICFVWATQIPELMGRAAWDNQSTVICLRLPSQESRKKVGGILK